MADANGNFITTLWRRFSNRTAAPTTTNPPLRLFMRRAGMFVSPETAMEIAAVFSCVRYIAEKIGILPWGVYLKDSKGARQEHRTSPLWQLLHTRPNPETGAMAFKETLTGWALTWGNGYAEIERDMANRPVALWPLPPDRVRPMRATDGALIYEVSNGAAKERTYLAAENMFHLHGLGYDGITGYSVISLAARSIGTALASDTFSNSFFANNTVLGGVLEHPEKLSPEAYERIKESWEARHKGPSEAYKPAILEEGMKWHTIGMPLKDAEFLESRKFTVTEICRWFGVPPHKVADLERATYSNIEHQSIEVVTDAIMPWAVRLEQEADYKLIGARNQGTVFTKLNLKGLLRGDSKTRAEFYQAMRQMGVFSVNDIRELEDMNPIGPAGDKRVMQSQYTTLEKIGEEPAPPAPAPPGDPDDET
jgi:HK97 family phage portal protein